MLEIVSWITSHSDLIISAASKVVAAASAIAAITPTPSSDSFIGKLYKIVDWLALNIGKAKDTGKDDTQK
jgi:hypothetical protein